MTNWVPIESRRFAARSDGEGGKAPIPPFTFPIAFYTRLLIETSSRSAGSGWWQAGWVNLLEQDADLPTFTAIATWRRLPLGASLLDVPTQGFYQVRIEPQPYFLDFVVRVWAK